MITIPKDPRLTALQKKWEEAKNAEKGWNDLRKQVETEILKLIPEVSLLNELPDKGTVRLDQIDITFGKTRTFNQGKLASVVDTFEWLLDSLFRTEFVVNSNPRLDKFIAAGDDEGVGQRLSECIEEKDRRPSFKLR